MLIINVEFKTFCNLFTRESGTTYTKTISREYAEMMMEEAEELLLITSKIEQNGETTYKLNYQLLKNRKLNPNQM